MKLFPYPEPEGEPIEVIVIEDPDDPGECVEIPVYE